MDYKYSSSKEERKIADVNKRANAAGVSYGRYIAGERSSTRSEKDIRDKPNFWWNEKKGE